MPISLEKAKLHQQYWVNKLAPFSDRASWPRYLFHICQLEVAAEIIRAKKVLCRKNVANLICDVANQGALWNNPNAHDFVRLYFRPKTWFHFKTEGVKSTTDRYRVDPHMAIPVAFAFDFERVMTLENAFFVSGNFAKQGQAPLSGDLNFDSLDFSKIYHEAPLSRELVSEYNDWRMSEVVVKGELSLDCVSSIVCRTIHEERMLKDILGADVPPTLTVEQRRGVFVRKGIFIDEIFWETGNLIFSFHGPLISPKPSYSIKVTCSVNS
jgi:ssDNA thymidine ADP-ribosyltransferase, DarT